MLKRGEWSFYHTATLEKIESPEAEATLLGSTHLTWNEEEPTVLYAMHYNIGEIDKSKIKCLEYEITFALIRFFLYL